MEKKHLNNDDLKPRKWLLYLLIVVNIIIVIILANKIMIDKKQDDEKKNNILDIFDFGNYENEHEKKSFNWSFEMYSGTEHGISVSNLIDTVITNNKTNNKHIITVVFDDIRSTDSTEIRSIKKRLDDWTEYEVILDYDENGFVYLITIEK